MKIINSLKRIFSHLTIFDVVALAIVFSLIIGFYFVFRRETKYIDVKFKITDENVLYANTKPTNEYAHSFQVGDTIKDELGREIARITEVIMYDFDPDTQVVYLKVNLKTLYNPRKETYSLRGKDIIFGETFTLDFSKVHVNALVVDYPGFESNLDAQEGKVIVMAQLRSNFKEFSDTYGVPKYLAEAVKPQDQISDNQGHVLAKVIDVQIKPATRTATINDGRIVSSLDPTLYDVFYTIELTTKNINSHTYMFDYIPVAINQSIPLNFQQVTIWPTIIKINLPPQ